MAGPTAETYASLLAQKVNDLYAPLPTAIYVLADLMQTEHSPTAALYLHFVSVAHSKLWVKRTKPCSVAHVRLSAYAGRGDALHVEKDVYRSLSPVLCKPVWSFNAATFVGHPDHLICVPVTDSRQ